MNDQYLRKNTDITLQSSIFWDEGLHDELPPLRTLIPAPSDCRFFRSRQFPG